MRTAGAASVNWRDAAHYAPLLDADRSLFAWEWLRRNPAYCAAAAGFPSGRGRSMAAPAFGLVRFESPDRAVPLARPLWSAEAFPLVLEVEPVDGAHADAFELARLEQFATLAATRRREHLLLSDGFRTIRLDGPRGAFSGGASCLRYRLEGLASAGPRLVTLQRFLALCRSGVFRRILHPSERRAQRWIALLRAFDAVAAGATQREIAGVLVRASASAPRWRSREPSVRSGAQRLVRTAARFAAGGYLGLLDPRRPVGDARSPVPCAQASITLEADPNAISSAEYV